jgi:hypothetical protein
VFLDKDSLIDNVQKHNICTNVPSSQTFRSYLPDSTFNMMRNKIAILEILNKQGFSSVRLLTQCMAYPQRFFRWTLDIQSRLHCSGMAEKQQCANLQKFWKVSASYFEQNSSKKQKNARDLFTTTTLHRI